MFSFKRFTGWGGSTVYRRCLSSKGQKPIQTNRRDRPMGKQPIGLRYLPFCWKLSAIRDMAVCPALTSVSLIFLALLVSGWMAWGTPSVAQDPPSGNEVSVFLESADKASGESPRKTANSSANPDTNPSNTQTQESADSQTLQSKLAPIVLDGNPLFEVAGFENLTAEERAATFSEFLAVAVNQRRMPVVGVNARQGTITLNGAEFITVTKADAM
ncbi:MAG: hypothetical protein VKJ64_09640 [Leptolyngbyaceae bacterium]|nr:hypothetical protein [Leptolyngbyaceae bacterium]